MKRLSLILISFTLILFSANRSWSQNTLEPCSCDNSPVITNGDFESYSSPNVSFASVLNWQRGSGSPDIFGGSAAGANNYAWMWSYNANFGSGENIFTSYQFEEGKNYQICFDVRTNNPDGQIFLQAANGLGNGSHPMTNAPTQRETIFQDGMNYPTWQSIQVTYSPTTDFNFLWVYPLLNARPTNGQAEMSFDNIKVTVIPDSINYSISVDTTVCTGDDVQLNLFGTIGTTSTITWTGPNLSCTDCPNPIATVTSNSVYEVTVTDDESCFQGEVTIDVDSTLCVGTITVEKVAAIGGNAIDHLYAGQNFDYQITVTNNSASDITGLVVNDLWPTDLGPCGLTIIPLGNNNNPPAPQTINLLAGQTQVINYPATVCASVSTMGAYINCVDVTDSATGEVYSDCDTTRVLIGCPATWGSATGNTGDKVLSPLSFHNSFNAVQKVEGCLIYNHNMASPTGVLNFDPTVIAANGGVAPLVNSSIHLISATESKLEFNFNVSGQFDIIKNVPFKAEFELKETKQYCCTDIFSCGMTLTHSDGSISDVRVDPGTICYEEQNSFDVSLEIEGFDDKANLTAIGDFNPVLSQFLWSTGETTQTVTVPWPGSYSVVVTNQFGCKGEAKKDTSCYKVRDLKINCDEKRFSICIDADCILDKGIQGLDFDLEYDFGMMVPTGSFTIGDAINNPNAANAFISNEEKGKLHVSIFFNDKGSYVVGNGNVICIEFELQQELTTYQSELIALDAVESYDPEVGGEINRTTSIAPGVATLLQETNHKGDLEFRDDNVSITNNGTASTIIYESVVGKDGSCKILDSKPVKGDEKFSIGMTAGGNAVNIVRDIQNNTNIMSLVNGYDAFITFKIITNNYSPDVYELIAADTDNSGKIYAGDITEIFKRAILIQDHYSNNKDWKFVDEELLATPAFANATRLAVPQVPDCLPLIYDLENSCNRFKEENYHGILIGDVSGSWATSNRQIAGPTENNSLVTFDLKNLDTSAPNRAILPIKLSVDQTVYSLDIDLGYASDKMILKDVYFNQELGKDGVQDLWNNKDGNTLLLSSMFSNGVTSQEAIYFIEFETQEVLSESDFNNVKVYLNGENTSFEFAQRTLDVKQVESLNAQFYPNPFSENLTIRWESTSIEKLEIVSIDGKVIRSINVSNLSTYQLDLSDVSKGMYFVQLDQKNAGKVIKK